VLHEQLGRKIACWEERRRGIQNQQVLRPDEEVIQWLDHPLQRHRKLKAHRRMDKRQVH
jgi:hypothetical protein